MPSFRDSFQPTETTETTEPPERPQRMTEDGRIRVIDGDTLELRDPDSGQSERVRLQGFNTPEVESFDGNRPAQQQGDVAGDTLFHRIQDARAEGNFDIELTDEYDKYGRRLGRVTSQGRDLGEMMRAEGLAAKTSFGGEPALVTPQDLNTDPEQFERAKAAFHQDALLDAEMSTRHPGPTKRYHGTNLQRSITRGTDQMAGGFNALIGRDDEAQKNFRDASMNVRDMDSFRDIESVGDFGSFFVQLLGEEAPGLALDALGVVAGAFTGGASTAAVAARRGATTVATQAGKAGARTVGQNMRTGAIGGATLSMLEQTSGSVAGDLLSYDDVEYGERLVASLGAGALMTPVNLIFTGRLLKDVAGAFGFKSAQPLGKELSALMATPSFQSRMAQVAQVSGEQGVAELIQQGIAMSARELAVNGEMPDAETWVEFWSGEGADALVAGGLLGGAISGGAHGVGATSDQIRAFWQKASIERELGSAEFTVSQEREAAQAAAPGVAMGDRPAPMSEGMGTQTETQAGFTAENVQHPPGSFAAAFTDPVATQMPMEDTVQPEAEAANVTRGTFGQTFAEDTPAPTQPSQAARQTTTPPVAEAPAQPTPTEESGLTPMQAVIREQMLQQGMEEARATTLAEGITEQMAQDRDALTAYMTEQLRPPVTPEAPKVETKPIEAEKPAPKPVAPTVRETGKPQRHAVTEDQNLAPLNYTPEQMELAQERHVSDEDGAATEAAFEQRTFKNVVEAEAAAREVQKLYGATMDRATATAVRSALKQQFPTAEIQMLTVGDQFGLNVRETVYPTREAAEARATEFDAAFGLDRSVQYEAESRRGEDGETEHFVKAVVMDPENEAYQASQHLPRIFAQGKRYNKDGDQLKLRGPDGNIVPANVQAITSWGMETVTADVEPNEGNRRRRAFSTGLANVMMQGYDVDPSMVGDDGRMYTGEGTARRTLNVGTAARFIPFYPRRRDNVELADPAPKTPPPTEADFPKQVYNERFADPDLFRQILEADPELREQIMALADAEGQLPSVESLLAMNEGVEGANVFTDWANVDDRAPAYYLTDAQVQLRKNNRIFELFKPRREVFKKINRLRYAMQQQNKPATPAQTDRLIMLQKQLEDVTANIQAELRASYPNAGITNAGIARAFTDREGQVYNGSMPFSFLQASLNELGGVKVGENAVVFGDMGDMSTRNVLKAFASFEGFDGESAPNVMLVVGDAVPKGKVFDRFRAQIKDGNARSEGAVFHGAGQDFALVYINPNQIARRVAAMAKAQGRKATDADKSNARAVVTAHELAHIYVEQAVNEMAHTQPEVHARLMRAMAQEYPTHTDMMEGLTNELAYSIFQSKQQKASSPANNADASKLKTTLRHWWDNVIDLLGGRKAVTQRTVRWMLDQGMFRNVKTGYSSPYTNAVRNNFTATVAGHPPGRLNRMWDAIKEGAGSLSTVAAPIVQTVDTRMRKISTQLADAMWLKPGTRGEDGRTNMLMRRQALAQRLMSEWQFTVDKMGEDRFKRASENYMKAKKASDLNEDGKVIQSFYQRLHTGFKRRMPTIGEIDGVFVPTIYNPQALTDGYFRFEMIMRRYNDPATGKRYTKKQIEMIHKALTRTDGFADPELDRILEQVENRGIATAPEAWSSRSRQIKDRDLLEELRNNGFVEADMDTITSFYTWQMTRRAVFEETFGDYRDVELSTHYNSQSYQTLQKLIDRGRSQYLKDEAQRILDRKATAADKYAALTKLGQESGFLRVQGTGQSFGWYDPTHQLTEMLQAIPDRNRQREAYSMVKAYMGRVGLDMDPTARKIMSRIQTYQAYRTLGFSTVASFPDLMGPILRARHIEYMLPAMRSAMKGLMQARKTWARGKEFGYGVARIDNLQIQETYGQNFQDAVSQKWSNQLFKWNGQQMWTSMSRSVAVQSGMEVIQLAAQDARSNKPKVKARGEGLLNEFGLTVDDIETFRENGYLTVHQLFEGEGTAPGAKRNAQKIHDALFRYVDESIVRPNAALRPEWASNPAFMLFWQLKSFFYAYGKVVVTPFLEAQGKRMRSGDIAGGLAPFVAAVPGLLLLSFLGMQTRDLIQKGLSSVLMAPLAALDDEWAQKRRDVWHNSWFDSLTPSEYSWEMLRRTGVFGPMELAMGLGSDRPLESRVSGLLGPSPQQAVELFKLTSGLMTDAVRVPFGVDPQTTVAPTVLTSIPGVSQLPSFRMAMYN